MDFIELHELNDIMFMPIFNKILVVDFFFSDIDNLNNDTSALFNKASFNKAYKHFLRYYTSFKDFSSLYCEMYNFFLRSYQRT